MAEYDFYRNVYMGDAIPDAEFLRLIKRAEDKLAQYRRIYTIAAEKDGEAEKMAICAMAEALYNAETVANGESSIQSAAIGSVSTTYGGAIAQAVDVTPTGIERALFRAALLYIDIYTGVS